MLLNEVCRFCSITPVFNMDCHSGLATGSNDLSSLWVVDRERKGGPTS